MLMAVIHFDDDDDDIHHLKQVYNRQTWLDHVFATLMGNVDTLAMVVWLSEMESKKKMLKIQIQINKTKLTITNADSTKPTPNMMMANEIS